MDYKKTVEELKAFFNGQVTDESKVELAEDVAKDVVAEPAPEAPSPTYVTLEQFNSLKEEQEKFMVSVTEMLSKAMEMINTTEKNTVPQELAKEEVAEEVVELAEEPVATLVHDPEGLQKDVRLKAPLSPNRRMTTVDTVMSTLWGNK